MSDDGTTSLIVLWNLALKDYKNTVDVDLSSYRKIHQATSLFEFLEARLEKSTAFRKQDSDGSLLPALQHVQKFEILRSSEVTPVFDPARDVVESLRVLVDIALRSKEAYEFVIGRLNEVNKVLATLEIEPERAIDTSSRRKFLQILIDLLNSLMIEKPSPLSKLLRFKPRLAKPGALDALRSSVETANTLELSADPLERRLRKLWREAIQQFRAITDIDLAAPQSTLRGDSPDALLAVLPGRLGIESQTLEKPLDTLRSVLGTVQTVIALAPLGTLRNVPPLMATLTAVEVLLRTTLKVAYDDTNEFLDELNKALQQLKGKLVHCQSPSDISADLKSIVAEIPVNIFQLFIQAIKTSQEKSKRTGFHQDDKVRKAVSEVECSCAEAAFMSWDTRSSSHSIAQLSDTWILALRKYRLNTGKSLLASTAYLVDPADHLLSYLDAHHDKFISFRKDGKKMRDMVMPVLKFLEKFSNIAAEGAALSFPPSKAIFAAIRALFDGAKKVTEGYDTIESLFRLLDSFSCRLEVYRDTKIQPALQKILVEILVRLLVVLGLSRTAIAEGRVVSFVKTIAMPNDEIQTAMKELEKLIDDEHRMVTTLNLELANKIKDSMDDREILDLGNWLSPHYFGVPPYVIEQRTSGTGKWITEQREFQDWVRGDIRVLFCPGNPGAGKTFITSRVFTYLEELQNVQRNDDAVAQLYFHYKSHESQTTRNLIADLLKQLIQGRSPSSSCIFGLQKLRQKRGQMPPSMNELIDILQSVIDSYGTVFLVVDALDEANERTRGEFVKHLYSLAPKVRFMVTSRNLSPIEELFPRPETIWISISPTNDDLKRHVENELQNRSALLNIIRRAPGLHEDIMITVATTAKDMFLLARMHLNLLESKLNAREVREALKKLPDTTNGAYAETMERIETLAPAHAYLAKSLLAWITYAKEPLSLEELQIALVIPRDSPLEELNEDDYTPGNTLAELCLGLVVIDEEHGTIRFVHETAQTYFEKEQPPIHTFEATIAMKCLRYLAFYQGKGTFNIETLKSALNNIALLNYATRFWGAHALKVQDLIKDAAISIFFDRQGGQFGAHGVTTSSWPLQSMYRWRYATLSSALHLFAWFGLEKLAEAAVDFGVNSKDTDGRTPISYAAESGHDSVLQVLVKCKDIDVNSAGNNGRTPLSYAAESGCERAIQVLLNCDGIDGHSADSEGRTPLSYAARRGSAEVVELLLRHDGIAVDSVDSKGRTPLSYAVEWGKAEVVELLLRHDDIAVNSADSEGRTPLSYAAEFDWADVVELLINSAGIAVNLASHKDRTPLSYAAQEGHEDVVERLLRFDGIDVNAKDTEGRTSLSYVPDNPGGRRIAQALVKHGAIDAN